MNGNVLSSYYKYQIYGINTSSNCSSRLFLPLLNRFVVITYVTFIVYNIVTSPSWLDNCISSNSNNNVAIFAFRSSILSTTSTRTRRIPITTGSTINIDHRQQQRNLQSSFLRLSSVSEQSTKVTIGTSSSTSNNNIILPRLTNQQLQELKDNNYVVIENFISSALIEQLQNDVYTLRNINQFNIAKIGQDTTNTLDTTIRIAETCFIGKSKTNLPSSTVRNTMYTIVDQIRTDLSQSTSIVLDEKLSELLYAYYPTGGYYRRHRDAISGSASILREYSLLLYLNTNWTSTTTENNNNNGGELRIHFDNGINECPSTETPNYIDIIPNGGTLILFKSNLLSHEVLNTYKERIAIVGWYNKQLSFNDISSLTTGTSTSTTNPLRLGLLLVATLLIGFGISLL